MKNTSYNKSFYEERSDSTESAKEIVPYLLKLTKAQSVVDVGCGNGAFLEVFSKFGIKNFLGVDGEWVKQEYLSIPTQKFLKADFEQPLKINAHFDLALSLEVAEHISKDSANTFIKSITQLAPVVVFSAAIPMQGGTHHINEQWPSYWTKIFSKYNYVPIDCLRQKFWNNNKVSYWYSQNMILYVHKELLEKNKELNSLYKQNKTDEILSLVHPNHYIGKAKVWSAVWNLIPGFLKTFAKNTFNKQNT